MLSPRERIEQYEKKILAPYAALSSASRGRRYSIAEHPIRTAYQRDRDRVIHSAAFRRMEYKTQVFVSHEGDYYRNRLTHSLEVAQISRTIARALGLNEDLTEAIALVHDLGHTPFGHSGEEVLDALMAEFGGFNHNRQSLRVVDILERRYPEYPGLNLTYETREGIIKHETSLEPLYPEQFPPDENPTLEASLVDLADAIAYNCHDLDDGLSSRILNWDDLNGIALWAEAFEKSRKIYPELDRKMRRHTIVRILIDTLAGDLVRTSGKNLRENNIKSLSDIRKSGKTLVSFSEEVKRKSDRLKQYLMANLYRHPHVKKVAGQARNTIESLFNYYRTNPDKLHGKFKLRLDEEPVEIIVCDFIAGMTDRYALRIYESIK